MERARDQLLASASLAEQQHGGIRVRDALDRAEDLLHRRRLPDDLAEAPLDLEFFLQVDVLRFELLGALPIRDVAGDERHGRIAVDLHAEQASTPFEPTFTGPDAQRIFDGLACSRLNRLPHDPEMRFGDRGRQDVVEPLALHFRWRSIQQVFARRQDFEITPFPVDDEYQIRKRVEDRGKTALAALQIGGARGHEIFQLVRVQFDALPELRLSHRDGEGARDLLCNFDRLTSEGILFGRSHVQDTNQIAICQQRHVDERAQSGCAESRDHASGIFRLTMLRTMPAWRSSRAPKVSIGMMAPSRTSVGTSSCKAMICPVFRTVSSKATLTRRQAIRLCT